WSSSSAAELRDRLAGIPSFGAPRLGPVRDGDDGYSTYSITLDYVGPAEKAGADAPALADLLRYVPARDEIPQVQKQIRAILKDLQLKVADYRTGSKPRENAPLDLWPISIRLDGATLSQVALLLDRLSRLPRLLVLEELATEARDKDHPGLAVRLELSLATHR
ncbi:MAG TPA: type 4a pilus biogenesis protein PilO, partial [Thermoanaerobaculia bacterium]|nr:type 4a pilus biogenesis protein PilO [Thermoanaerobaculia bacterium]